MEVSACLVVRNEEAVIRRCLASLRGVADEIILVHDGPCEDSTVDIANEFGCRVFVRPLVGNPEHHTVFAYEQARGEWLLSLDADEFLSTEMAAVIPELIRRDDYAAWSFLWLMWDGRRYITATGPHKPSLFRRDKTSLVGHLQRAEEVDGRVGIRDEMLHHQPLYNNFSFKSVSGKYRRWCSVQARELVNPFSEIPKFNYSGPDRWPWQRHLMNLLSPVLAVPNGVIHFLLTMRRSIRDGTELDLRLAFYQGVYATLLQLYVARYMYVDGGVRRMTRVDDGRR